MSTRWFVEVSAEGETQPARYCVEAQQWQFALLAAQKLLGDSGPLSRFSIELSADGYRALDRKTKHRYFVTRAPADAALTAIPPGRSSNRAPAPSSPPRASPFAPPSSPQAAPAPMAPMAPIAPAPMAPMAPIAPAPMAPIAPVPVAPVAPAPVLAPTPVASAPLAAAAVAEPAPPQSAADARAEAERRLTGGSAPPPSEFTTRDLMLIRSRMELPTETVPIEYHEYAYAAPAGIQPDDVKRLLYARFAQIVGAIEEGKSRKFVQLAIFDHAFEKNPQRPPLGSLAWKDWRGDPVLTITPGPYSQPPPAVARAPSAPAAEAIAPGAFPMPARPMPSEPPTPPEPILAISSQRDRAPPPPQRPRADSEPVVDLVRLAHHPHAAAPSEAIAVVGPPIPVGVATEPVMPPHGNVPSFPGMEPLPAPAAAPEVEEARPRFPSDPPIELVKKRDGKSPSEPSPRRARRGPEDDLIGDLFEQMHHLHFMPDVVAGADYVLGVVWNILPAEAVVIHVYDINSRHFIVVRAKGGNGEELLLHRTPDTEPLFVEAMRRTRSIRISDASEDPRVRSIRWHKVGVPVWSLLCGPVQQGGRYLGLIEIANPLGNEPFYRGEANALDYICEQFGDFIARRPIVLEADTVLPNRRPR